jgi:hypothetical protein
MVRLAAAGAAGRRNRVTSIVAWDFARRYDAQL